MRLVPETDLDAQDVRPATRVVDAHLKAGERVLRIVAEHVELIGYINL